MLELGSENVFILWLKVCAVWLGSLHLSHAHPQLATVRLTIPMNSMF